MTEAMEPAAAEMLLEREAKGLQVPSVARIGLALFGGFSAVKAVSSVNTLLLIWALVATVVAVNAASVYALRRRQHVSWGTPGSFGSYRCLAHRSHPLVGISPNERERWLDVYCESAHVLVGPSGRGPGAVDRVLEQEGRSRQIALRVPYFLAAAPVVQATQLVLTIPSRAAQLFAHENPQLEVMEIPMDLPRFTVATMWHTRYEHDPGLQWLRRVLRDVVQKHVPEMS